SHVLPNGSLAALWFPLLACCHRGCLLACLPALTPRLTSVACIIFGKLLTSCPPLLAAAAQAQFYSWPACCQCCWWPHAAPLCPHACLVLLAAFKNTTRNARDPCGLGGRADMAG
ncbi:hypothetical protein E2320_016874, partial [Naja naja]